MTSQLRGVRRFRRTSKTPMDIWPAFESLENRVLLSGLPSNETAYMRFNGRERTLARGLRSIPWTGPAVRASSFPRRWTLTPACCCRRCRVTRPSPAPIFGSRKQREKAPVVTAEQISAVAVKSLDLAGSGTQKVTEDATISFAGLELTTIQRLSRHPRRTRPRKGLSILSSPAATANPFPRRVPPILTGFSNR